MDPSKCPADDSLPLEAVITTAELSRRPSRRPDYRAENQALVALTRKLTESPNGILQELVQTALELCRADSAGVSLLEEEGGRKIFRWHAVAGAWAGLVWTTTTARENSPCGTVLDRNATLLFSNAHRYYTQFAEVRPLLIEGLLVPFHIGGKAVGTVWVVAHHEHRKFDAEDQRVLESLATLAATAYQVLTSLKAAKARTGG